MLRKEKHFNMTNRRNRKKKVAITKKKNVKMWKKVLYLKQNVPDNYVDSSFLGEMKENVNLQYYAWHEAALVLCPVTLEICCTISFILTFVFMENEYISPLAVMICSNSIIISCCACHFLLCPLSFQTVYEASFLRNAKNGFLLLSFGYIFSPILKTLTATISTDTIFAMAAVMLIVHVISQDYSTNAVIVCSCLSVNSAIFAAICLASRLSTVQQTFALVTFAVEILLLSPFLRFILQKCSIGLPVITGIFTFLVTGLLGLLGKVYAILFFLFVIFINITCPMVFVHYQIYKQNIYGPWDEAVIREDMVT